MESDRVHARGVIMREAKNAEDAADAEGGWLDWLARLRRPGDRRRRHPGPGAPHPRPGGDARRDLPRRARRRRGARAGRTPSRRWRAPTSRATVTPRRAGRARPAPGPTWSASTPGSSTRIIRQLRERGCRMTLLPVHSSAERGAGAGSGPGLPRQRPGRPGGARLRRRHGPRAGRQAARVRHLPRPPAPLPGGGPRDLQAALRPPRRQPPGQGPGHRADRDHLPEPRLRGPGPGRRVRRSRATSRFAGRPTSAPPSSPT